MKSKQEVVSLSVEKNRGVDFVIKDSLKNDVGYLGSKIHYDFTDLEKGFNKIDQGLIFT